MSARAVHYLTHRYELEALIVELAGPDTDVEHWLIALELLTILFRECHGCGAPLGQPPRPGLLCAECQRQRPWERN